MVITVGTVVRQREDYTAVGTIDRVYGEEAAKWQRLLFRVKYPNGYMLHAKRSLEYQIDGQWHRMGGG